MRTFLLISFILLSAVLAGAQNLEFVSRTTYSGQNMSSIWGYTTPEGKEFALVGTTRGLSIVDISNPVAPIKAHFINGVQGTWREVKTYSHFAYVSQDNSNNEEGVLIIDLKNVGDSVQSKDFRGGPINVRKVHTLWTDSLGYLYLFGGTQGGCVIYSIKEDPWNPIYVGKTSDEYIHEGYTRGDTLWAANVFAGTVSVWDLRDRSNPVKIAAFNTPMNFTHNAWLSDDSKTLFTTDEKNAASVAAYDVSEITDVKLMDEWKLRPSEQSIPHNVHVLDDYLVISHYTEGVVICDALDPRKIITVGKYDTSPNFSGGGFNGCWGVYPYFSSGLIIASDIQRGMFVLRPKYERGVRAFGKVLDANTLQPINRATVYFTDNGDTTLTNFDGEFKFGRFDTGFFTIKAEAEGYVAKEERRLYLRGSIFEFEILLEKVSTSANGTLDEKTYTVLAQGPLLQVRSNDANPVQFQLYNAAGAEVLRAQTLSTGVHNIDWSQLSSGLYIATVSTNSGIFSQKVFKN